MEGGREREKGKTARLKLSRFVPVHNVSSDSQKNWHIPLCFRGEPGGSEPAELSRWISPGTLGHARAYAKHRRALPQIHGQTDGAEVTIEERDTEFTEHAHDGRSDDGRWTGGCPSRRRCRGGGRVFGRGGDQKTIDGQQASGELRLEALGNAKSFVAGCWTIGLVVENQRKDEPTCRRSEAANNGTRWNARASSIIRGNK